MLKAKTSLAATATAEAGHAPPRLLAAGVDSRLLTQWWEQLLSLSADANPLAGAGDGCLRLGPHGHVLSPVAPAGSITCTVPRRTKLFLVAASSSCDDVEPPPFYAVGQAGQRACAREGDQVVEAARFTLDGETTDLRTSRYEVFSRQASVMLPEANIVGVQPQPMTFTAHGWAALVPALSPGEHVLRHDLTIAGETHTSTTVIRVLAPES
jgi:hypothetical protein